MGYRDFNMKEHGFSGHMALTEQISDKAVIVIMGGERTSVFSACKSVVYKKLLRLKAL